MIKVGNWYIPESDYRKRKEMVETENFTCIGTIDYALNYVDNFKNAIDIGTWIGDSTRYLSRKFENVVGFEASNEVYQCCIKNLEEQQTTNCTIYNYGISNRRGTQKFLTKGTSWSGWIDTLETDNSKSKEISTMLLDDFNFKNIDFIKIDVDSHEGFLLEGAKKFFEDNNPVMMIEIKKTVHHRQNELMPDPFKIIDELGYKLIGSISKADYIFKRERNDN